MDNAKTKILIQLMVAMRFCDLFPLSLPQSLIKKDNEIMKDNPIAPHSQSHLHIFSALAREALHPPR